MDDLDMHGIENNHLDEENHQLSSTNSEILHNEENQSETQDMNDIGNDHYDEENHQFIYGDSEILHNDGNQSEIQVQSDNVAAQYGSCKQFIAANCSLFWIPEVEASWIPTLGSIFKDIKDAIKWYKGYALRSGFDIRKSTERKKSGIITSKYFICNRGGLPNSSTLDTISDDHNKQLRNSNCKRKNCKAFVAFKVIPHSSEVYLWRFEQQHNHKLINQDCMHLSRAKCIVWYLYLLLALIITKGASLLELVSWETMNESDFKVGFNSIVWDSKIVVNDFEMRWDALMVKYKLQDNKWMKDMFDLRSSWIPAYFQDVPMSGLMRTTSRSESENSTFNRVSHHGYTFNNFMNSFEFVMERQRNNQIKFDFDTSTIIPIIKTPLEDMEKHASVVYTRTIFLMVPREIFHSLVSCSQKSVTSGIVSDICIVKHKRTNISKKKVVVEKKEKVDIDSEWNFDTSEGDFEVKFNREDLTVKCSCMLFERFGIFCRHIFFLKRTFRYGDSSGNVEKVAYKAFSMLDQCLSSLSNDDKKLEEFMQKLEVFMTDIGEQGSDKLPVTKEAHIDKLYGATTNPEVVDVENPPMVKNKGFGTGKRFKSALEKATNQGNKQSRS
ncbi:unnamed protein product [Lactuca saligna]|uniref:SWIM-type domain-containing protein n=1 Tax=Lactuca saligna TaxID=75948 RepID=A0AA36EKK5_LACSI|nr:unnamed protein product [Lactuca saligna]